MSEQVKLSDQESIEILNSLIPPLKTKKSEEHHVHFTNLSKLSVKDEDEKKKEKTIPTIIEPEPSSGGGGCPFFMGSKNLKKQLSVSSHSHAASHPEMKGLRNPEWQTSVSIATEPVFYHDYLQLDKILQAQFPVSAKYGSMVHDEHLFIIIHQGWLYDN